MFHFAAMFFIFVILVVIIFLTAQWGMARLGWKPDPALMTIVGLFVFLCLFILFLNYLGAVDINSWGTGLRH